MGILQLLYEQKRREWEKQDEETASARKFYDWALQQDDAAVQVRNMEKSLKEKGIEVSPEEKLGLIIQNIASGALKQIDPEAMKAKGEPLPPPEAIIPFERSKLQYGDKGEKLGYAPEVEYYTPTPKTERIQAQTAAAQIGTIEGTLTGQENTRERRQRLALEERTSTIGRKLFEQKLLDDSKLQRQQKMIGLEFEPPPYQDYFDEAGNQLRQDYEYVPPKREGGKGTWQKKGKPRIVKYAVTKGDKLAMKREIVRMLSEIQKLDSIDYNEAMKMAIVDAISKTNPALGEQIAALETRSEEGKRKFKAVIGSYINDLREGAEIGDEEWNELVGPFVEKEAATPARDYGPDPLGIFSEVP